MYQVGEMVVHPGYGVGKVVGIERLSCLGSDKKYYSVSLVDGSGTQIWIPVQDADEKGMRRPILEAQLSKVWRRLRAKPKALPSDHKERYEVVRQKLEDGDVLQVAEALRDLSWKDAQGRSLTSEGKRLYEKAMQFLVSEVAVVGGSDPDSVEAEIARVLHESMARREAAQ